MSKIAYIIPGYGGSCLKDKASKKIAKMFEVRGIKPIFIEINWSEKKQIEFKQYVNQFLKQYKKEKGDPRYVLGFSLGATIALLGSLKAKPDQLILCSLSPYFKEDFKRIPSDWLDFWRKRYTKSEYVFSKLAPRIKSKTQLFVGDKEGNECLARAKEAKQKIKGSKLAIIKGAKHKLGQKEYLAEVGKFIRNL